MKPTLSTEPPAEQAQSSPAREPFRAYMGDAEIAETRERVLAHDFRQGQAQSVDPLVRELEQHAKLHRPPGYPLEQMVEMRAATRIVEQAAEIERLQSVVDAMVNNSLGIGSEVEAANARADALREALREECVVLAGSASHCLRCGGGWTEGAGDEEHRTEPDDASKPCLAAPAKE